ncbi:unnamed protein product [Sphenostylis stenocarpa]|uniref:Uncharacterized protein n=1 Tax=Sphenostylis stenocarpa TaxID=92480 RepID=A0AA86RKP5_9FABA|nr:unnamed protein product [Sphenostylis stenocarpa]
MASTPFSTLCHFHKPSLRFLPSHRFRFDGASAMAFPKVPKNRKMVSFPVCRIGPAVAFRDLDADDFRHPLDKQNTLILRAIPGLNELGKVLLGNKQIPRVLSSA